MTCTAKLHIGNDVHIAPTCPINHMHLVCINTVYVLSLSTTHPLYTATPSWLIVGLVYQTHLRVQSDHGGGQSVHVPCIAPHRMPF